VAYEVATAYVSIVPSMKGIQRSIAEELGGVDRQATKSAKLISHTVGKSLKKVGKIGVASIGGMAAGLAGMVAKGGFDRALQIEGAQAKLEGMKMSASQVEAVMSDALKSVKGTAFGMGDAATVAAQLSAAGVQSGKDLESALSSVADIAQMSGSSLTEIGIIYGKVAAKGKLQGDTLNQLMERGIAVMPALQQHLGKTADEVQDMVSRGEIDFATFKDAMGDAFGGAALASGETLPGAFANFKASLARLGEGPAVKIMEALRNAFNDMIPAIDTLSEKAGPVFDRFGEWFGNAAGAATEFFTGLVDGSRKVDTSLFTALADGARALWDGLKNVWDIHKPVVGAIGGAVKDLLPHVVEFVGKVGELTGAFLQNETAVRVLVGVAGGLTAVWAVGRASEFVKMVKVSAAAFKAQAAQMTIAKGATLLYTGAQKLLNLALSMNPIGLVVMALAALGAALVVAWNKSETFRSIVIGAWEGIQSAVSSVWGFMRDVVWPGLKGFVENLVGKFQDFKARISGAWDDQNAHGERVESYCRRF
jgi:tape measure domain-containing protein